jgi:hypothetical protein
MGKFVGHAYRDLIHSVLGSWVDRDEEKESVERGERNQLVRSLVRILQKQALILFFDEAEFKGIPMGLDLRREMERRIRVCLDVARKSFVLIQVIDQSSFRLNAGGEPNFSFREYQSFTERGLVTDFCRQKNIKREFFVFAGENLATLTPVEPPLVYSAWLQRMHASGGLALRSGERYMRLEEELKTMVSNAGSSSIDIQHRLADLDEFGATVPE